MISETQDNVEATAVASAARRVYRLLDDGLGSIGGIEVAAGLCGTDRGDLRRSLDRNGRRVAFEYVMSIGTRLRHYNATLATQLASALVEPMGFEVFPRVMMTDKERADRLEALVRRMPLGEQMLADALGARR